MKIYWKNDCETNKCFGNEKTFEKICQVKANNVNGK